MQGEEGTVHYSVDGRIAHITMDRPMKLNAINAKMRDELAEAFHRFKTDRSVWVAIFTGTGKAFSTGHDLDSPLQPGMVPGRGKASLDQLYCDLSELNKPVIGAINGYCLAQGAALALLTDIRIAVPAATFGWPQARMGLTSISGPAIATQAFPINVALESLFTGEPISAADAYRLGAVNRIVEPESLLACSEEIAKRICANGPLAISGMKQAALMGLGRPLRDRVEIAGLIAERSSATRDFAEGLLAYSQKRSPRFTGE